MLRLLVVDDETIIRRGIHYHIPWEEHGIEVVGEARDGEDGYQQALKLHPDIIIADIKMPRLNGIQMAEKIRSVFPDTAIIFLTGYEEKEYLLSAIRCGINDYIAKSANSQNILDAVLRIQKQILAKRTKEQLDSQELLELCLEPMKVTLISSIISGSVSNDIVRKQAQALDIPVSGPSYLPLLVPVKSTMSVNDLLLTMVFQFNQYHPCICYQESYGIVGFLNLDPLDSLEWLSHSCQELSTQYPGFQMLIHLPFQDFENAKKLYADMLRIASSLCWCRDEVLIHADQKKLKTIPADVFYLLESEILRAYQSKDTTAFIGKFDQFFTFAQLEFLPLDQLKDSLLRLSISISNLRNGYQDSLDINQVIESLQDPQELLTFMKDTFTAELPKVAHSAIVESAQEYIHQNYAKNIGLKEIAAYCHVSPSYISKIFKEDIQMGIVEFIHHTRIEQSKLLLENPNLKIMDIATEVGYSDYKRFSQYFLKLTGISPREYRKRL